ncbi:unnamed protein product [Rhizophagus irregularis]|nr:unnamed protein product [Rhizophagus irregularis]CAB5363663.1 unnamed protein product [Rhizophagus irregularis]
MLYSTNRNATKKETRQKKNPVWLHFIEGQLLNSSKHEAQCRYCFGKIMGKMGDVLSNMLKHLKEECSNISEELRNILYDSDNIIIRQKKNKRSCVEAELSDDDNDENVTHHNKQNLLWIRVSLPTKFIKLFKMIRPSYNLPSRKWISTEILDQVHKEVDREIQTFAKADFIR